MPKNPRGSKARAVGSVKRAQKAIREFDKRKDFALTPRETRNAFHEGYGPEGVKVKFKKRYSDKGFKL